LGVVQQVEVVEELSPRHLVHRLFDHLHENSQAPTTDNPKPSSTGNSGIGKVDDLRLLGCSQASVSARAHAAQRASSRGRR